MNHRLASCNAVCHFPPVHHSFLDRYSDLESPLHRFDARVKAAVAAVAVVCAATVPPGDFAPLSLMLGAILALWLFSRVPLLFLAKRAAVLLPFIILMSLSAAWTKHRHLDSGALLFASQVVLRAVAALAALSLLASTTPFPKLLAALRWYRVPPIMLSLMAFAYRFIYILVDELEKLEIGRRSREFSGKLKTAWLGRAWMLGSFLVRSLERSERVYQAMLSRGYDGRPAAVETGARWRAREAWIGAAAIAVFVAVRIGGTPWRP